MGSYPSTQSTSDSEELIFVQMISFFGFQSSPRSDILSQKVKNTSFFFNVIDIVERIDLQRRH
jgi:hypothetical protein